MAPSRLPAEAIDEAAVRRALARQHSGEDHDAGLIQERLSWTPEQRLAANEEFLRFYLAARPGGPLIERG